MTEPMRQSLGELLLVGPPGLLAALILALAAAKGALSLRTAPRRAVALEPFDLLVALVLFFWGGLTVRAIVEYSHLEQKLDSEDFRAVLAMGAQIAMQAPCVLYLLIRIGRQPGGMREWGLVPRRPVRELLAGSAGFVLGVPLVLTLNGIMIVGGLALGAPRPESGHELLKVMQETQSPLALTLLSISAIAFAPLLEELIFRGLVQTVLLNLFGRDRRWAVLIVSAALFASVHIGATPWQTRAGMFTLGLMFGWLYERSGSLLPGMIMHGAFNAANVALLFLTHAQEHPTQATTHGLQSVGFTFYLFPL